GPFGDKPVFDSPGSRPPAWLARTGRPATPPTTGLAVPSRVLGARIPVELWRSPGGPRRRPPPPPPRLRPRRPQVRQLRRPARLADRGHRRRPPAAHAGRPARPRRPQRALLGLPGLV